MSSEVSSVGSSGFPAVYIGTCTTLAISDVNNQTSAVPDITTIYRLFSTVDCFIAIGANPVASSSSMFLPGGIVEYIGVTKSMGFKLGVIQKDQPGTLYVMEGA